jgi:hypothetical protein
VANHPLRARPLLGANGVIGTNCGAVPSLPFKSARQSGENGRKITTAAENAQNGYGIGRDLERDHPATFEAENPQAGARLARFSDVPGKANGAQMANMIL